MPSIKKVLSTKKISDLFDNRNTKIEIGKVVSYNVSGEIGYGVVVNIKPRVVKKIETISNGHSWIRDEVSTRETIYVQRKDKEQYKLSEVRSEKNVMVIVEYDALKKAATDMYEAFALHHNGIFLHDFIVQKIAEWTS